MGHRNSLRRKFAGFALLCSVVLPAGPASAVENFVTKAPQVLLIDGRSGTVLLSQNADKPIPPASLAKLMTAEVVFEALQKGELALERSFTVSEYAWRTGGAPSGTSTMFAAIKSAPTVADLLQGMIVQAANDGAIVLAEGMSGSEAAFVELMNKQAQSLGMSGSKFVNATGLPAEGQMITLTDLIRLTRHIHAAHPQFYRYYAQPEFKWNNILQRNRNPLLRLDLGADGFATGYTEASGFALAASAEKNGRRLFLAMSGLESSKDREIEARRLIEWGMNGFDDLQIFKLGDLVGDAKVFGGNGTSVPLKVGLDVEILLPKGEASQLKAKIYYDGPLVAPIVANQEIGHMKLIYNGNILKEVPVFAAQNLEKGSLSQRATSAIVELSTGWLRQYF